MNETRLKNLIIQAIRRKYPSTQLWMYKTSDRFTRGIPDLIICLNGKFIALEIKIPRGKIEPIQTYTINEINRSGGNAFIVYSVNEAIQILSLIQ